MARPSAGMLARMSMEPDDYPPPERQRGSKPVRPVGAERQPDQHQPPDASPST